MATMSYQRKLRGKWVTIYGDFEDRGQPAFKRKKKVAPKKKRKRQQRKRYKNVKCDSFLQSYEWRKARYIALKNADGKCQLCGRSKHDGIILNVDHIKPRKTHPKLALVQRNLQVLCHDCNHGKSNIDATDWRIPKG